MPLIDLARVNRSRGLFTWETVNSGWAGNITQALNDLLPAGFVAVESARFGSRLEMDVGTFEEESGLSPPSGNGSVALQTWAPPGPVRVVPANIPDQYELRIFENEGNRLVAAVELVSPSNKDRPAERRAFVAKCAGYLKDGVSLAIVDTVTTRRFNLYHELMELLEESQPDSELETSPLYAVSFRPVERDAKYEIDIWGQPLRVGEPLPTLPLRLTGDTFVPVELEPTYSETLRRRRII
jgi:hypothetical protein